MEDKSIIIIGAGFAGLSAGIYAQMNGYKTRIYEMHSLPGGLCTAWKREGYTIDGCIHWLVGSNPESGMYRYWQEVGIAQDREFINMDEYMRYEGDDGRTFIIYSDVDKLEKHMLELSPQDAGVTREFIQGIRLGIAFDPPSESDPFIKRTLKGIKLGLTMVTKGRDFKKWMTVTARDFSARFKDPLIRDALGEMWFPEFPMFFILYTLAYLNNKNAGWSGWSTSVTGCSNARLNIRMKNGLENGIANTGSACLSSCIDKMCLRPTTSVSAICVQR